MDGSDSGQVFDLLIIGGGVNGAGIARDAAGRGFSVCLAEASDFGGATSSASSKLLHGGLRYLEYFEFRLVREALKEREVLLRAMPHISRPMRFVLPYDASMRFEGGTPTSRLLSVFMPWLRGRRPPWLIRLGLFLYDHLGGKGFLPGTRTLDLTRDEAGRALKPRFRKGFEYSDGWVEDSRLVILNLQDAVAKGAEVHRSTRVAEARFEGGLWHAVLDGPEGRRPVTARMAINAAGPWVDEVLRSVFGINGAKNVRLVRGSHIVVPKKFGHDRTYFFQNADSRIMFAIPYEGEFTLIGTTDADASLDDRPQITPAETEYLCRMASVWFAEPVRPDQIVWTYSGIRPLFDEGADTAAAATRDYVLRREKAVGQGTLVNVFGGKITTFRRLAEGVVDLIEETLGKRGPAWTATAQFPGGDFEVGGRGALAGALLAAHPWLDPAQAARLVRHYGTVARDILNGCTSAADMGQAFGGGLTEREVRHLMAREWARTAEDVVFRRTREGLHMTPAQIAALDAWMQAQTPR